jgi:hypothetical protein
MRVVVLDTKVGVAKFHEPPNPTPGTNLVPTQVVGENGV